MAKNTFIYDSDPYLAPYKEVIEARSARIEAEKEKIAVDGSLSKGLNNHLYYGIHRDKNGYWFREFAPAAKALVLVGDFNDWLPDKNYFSHGEWSFTNVGGGNWELFLPAERIKEGDLFKWMVQFPNGEWGERIPAYAGMLTEAGCSGNGLRMPTGSISSVNSTTGNARRPMH